MSALMDTLPLLGWRERAALPELGLGGIVAKIDTGAYSCALDVAWRREEAHDGVAQVVFALRDEAGGAGRVLRAPIVDRREVTDASGDCARRVFIRTRLRLGDWERDVDLGLVDRQGLRHRMLIGRAALAGHWCVDPGRTFLLGAGEVAQ